MSSILEHCSNTTVSDRTGPLQVAALTDRGRTRPTNQDMVLADMLPLPNGASVHLCLVADGMGGARAGEQASQIASQAVREALAQALAVQTLADETAWHQLMHDAVSRANQAVFQAATTTAAWRGMGTTIIVALIIGQNIYLASVGDSRAYLIVPDASTELEPQAAQLTTDHSIVARMVAAGQISRDAARTHPRRNQLYRAVGVAPSVRVDTFAYTLSSDAILLLCSDGLPAHLYDSEMARLASGCAEPDEACRRLIALANQRGGRDNLSVIIARR